MSRVFYHSVIHGLGFFICFMIWILRAQNNKTRFFYVLYSDKTWVFDQSEHAQGPIYVINSDKTWVFDQSERAQGPIHIIIFIRTLSEKVMFVFICLLHASFL